jgi:outer membrane receptor for ferrienterochelin and colicins
MLSKQNSEFNTRTMPRHTYIVFAASLCAFSAQAQEAEKPAVTSAAQKKTPELTIQKAEVKGALSTYDARRNDTATKIVVTETEIQKNGDTAIEDVLKRLPGITVNNGIRMRGLGNGYTQILLNGEPTPPGFTIESLSPDMIERIEIIRAATAEFSTQAIAGTINVITKRTVKVQQHLVKLNGQHDGDNKNANFSLQSSDKIGDISYALGGATGFGEWGRPTIQTDVGKDQTGAVTRDRITRNGGDGRYTYLNASPRVNWTVDPQNTISSQTFINFSRSNGKGSRETDVKVGAPPPLVKTYSVNESETTSVNQDFNWLRKLENGKFDVKAGFNYNHRNTRNIGDQYDPSGVLALQYNSQNNDTDRGYSSNGKYTASLIEDHSFDLGWNLAYSKRGEDRIDVQSSQTNLPLDNINTTYDADVTRLAFYGQDEWSITDKLSTYVGMRWEGIQTKASATGFDEITNKSSVLSPLFQTLWKLPNSKGDQVRLAISRTYKAPSTYSLLPRKFTSRENTITSPDYEGNPNVKPELAWGLDLGFEHFMQDGALISTSAFTRRISDIMRQQTTQIGERWVSRLNNRGTANTRGVEMDAKLPLRAFWRKAPAIDLRVNMTRTWSTLDSVPGPNNRLDSQTPFSGNVGIDYKTESSGFSTGGNFNFKNAGLVAISDTQTNYKIPTRWLDLYALWKLDLKQQIRLSASNALHQDTFNQNLYEDSKGSSIVSNYSSSSAIIRAAWELRL